MDIALILLLLLAALAGVSVGFFATLGALLGLVAGVLAVPAVMPTVQARIPEDAWGGLAPMAVSIGLPLLGVLIGTALGHWLRRGTDSLRLRIPERALGGALAAVIGTLVIALVASGAGASIAPRLSEQVAESRVARTIGELTPQPAREAMTAWQPEPLTALPKLEGLLAGGSAADATGDPGALSDEVVQTASQSAAMVTAPAPACGTLASGSGFVAADGLVVTNAHVVAGTETTFVQLPGERQHRGEVVAFDDELDLAIISVDTAAAPLPLATQPLEPGDTGAVLGHPGGGRLTVMTAGIAARGEAAVGNIYGEGHGLREIYRVHAPVVPGNSGGPLITPGGEAAGVVFGTDATDSGYGYAVTAAELRPILESVTAERPEAVDTGDCELAA